MLLAGSLACREPKKKTPEVAGVAQDTMLLRDLAEANRNTAAANAVDNSLNTARTSGDESLPAMVDAAAQSRTPETRIVSRPPAPTSGNKTGLSVPLERFRTWDERSATDGWDTISAWGVLRRPVRLARSRRPTLLPEPLDRAERR